MAQTIRSELFAEQYINLSSLSFDDQEHVKLFLAMAPPGEWSIVGERPLSDPEAAVNVSLGGRLPQRLLYMNWTVEPAHPCARVLTRGVRAASTKFLSCDPTSRDIPGIELTTPLHLQRSSCSSSYWRREPTPSGASCERTWPRASSAATHRGTGDCDVIEAERDALHNIVKPSGTAGTIRTVHATVRRHRCWASVTSERSSRSAEPVLVSFVDASRKHAPVADLAPREDTSHTPLVQRTPSVSCAVAITPNIHNRGKTSLPRPLTRQSSFPPPAPPSQDVTVSVLTDLSSPSVEGGERMPCGAEGALNSQPPSMPLRTHSTESHLLCFSPLPRRKDSTWGDISALTEEEQRVLGELRQRLLALGKRVQPRSFGK